MSKLSAGRPTRKKELIAEVTGSTQESVKLNFNVPKQTHKKLKQKALDEDTTVTQLLLNAVDKVLSE